MGKSLTYTQQYGLFFGLKRFNESFKRFLTEKKDGVVTKQDVKYFYEDFKEREAKKRRNE